MSRFPEFEAWGRLGGKARAKRLSKQRMQEIARKAGSAKKKQREKRSPD